MSLVCAVLSSSVAAGPPYISDDPAPTEEGHYEIYAFTEGEHASSTTDGSLGIDFNYGAGPNLQLSATLPFGFTDPGGTFGLANVELAAKYRFLRNAPSGGWDAAFFPQLSLPASSGRFGATHATLFLPIWLEHDWQEWSTFGGGGCTINRGGDAKDFCQLSWALAWQIARRLQVGSEFVVTSAETKGGTDERRLGIGIRYDVDENYHLLAYSGSTVGANRVAGNYSWYFAVLSTF